MAKTRPLASDGSLFSFLDNSSGLHYVDRLMYIASK